ncbi:hypothetical protein BBI17_007652 [Phytophthora kernoviae]|uniref:Cyclic nucleotide-binding domain-containing protein n=1 Tax=Phytophthora kernoviae TaxID=325452 RepID=A0A421F1X8_9STRA|nr:hypothetical protein BBI17_007652 [Phytophthora kernoviae]
MLNEGSQSDDNDDNQMRANFSCAESDLLLVWARHTQAKTFRGVDDNTVREALRYLRFRQYQDGEAIFYQGDKGDIFYVLLEGSVGIYGALKRSQQPDKNKRKQSEREDTAIKNRSGVATHDKPDLNLMGPRLFTYRAGESFGETALFTNAAVRTATAIAFGAITQTVGLWLSQLNYSSNRTLTTNFQKRRVLLS